MLIYLFAIISIPIYNIIFRNKKLFVFVVTLQLFLILALRDVTMGVDLPGYLDAYHRIGALPWDGVWHCLHWFSRADNPVSFESGYGLLNWLCAQAGLSGHGFLVVCAAISVAPVGLFVYRYSDKPYLSFMLYVGLGCFFKLFGILRQSLAISILLLSIPYVLKRKWIPVLIFVFIAYSFHRVALLWLPLCFLFGMAVTRIRCLSILGGSLVAIPFVAILSNTILYPFLGMLDKGEYIAEHTTQYNNLFMIMWLVIAFITFFVNMNFFKNDRNNLSFWGLTLALGAEIFALYNATMARAAELLYIFIIILVPNIIHAYLLPSEKQHKLHTQSSLLKWLGQLSIIGLMCLLTYYFAYNYHTVIKIVPYRFY